MIGIQRSTVLDFSGKVRGSLLNNNYLGGKNPIIATPYDVTLKDRMVVKDIEIYTPNNTTYAYPEAMLQIVMVKDSNGNTIIPLVDQLNIGVIESSVASFLITYGLRHDLNSDKIWLYAQFKQRSTNGNATTFNICHWDHPGLINKGEWQVPLYSFTYGMNNNEHNLNIGAALSEESNIYTLTLHVDAISTSEAPRNVSVTIGSLGTVPSTKEELNNFYNTVQQTFNNYIVNDASAPNYVDGVPDYDNEVKEIESQMTQMESQITNVDDRVSAMETSTMSRFVSR